MCTAIFSYINCLPIAWRLSIWMDAFVGRPMMDDELVDGVDFYGRPTDALWFHLPRADRRRISVLLNVAWVTHFVSQYYHLRYWTTADGQTQTGSLGQNVPFVMSVVSGIAAGVMQGAAEKRTMKADPARFPPKAGEWVNSAVGDANARWREETRSTTKRCSCRCRAFSRRYWQLLREEMREEQEKHAKVSDEAAPTRTGGIFTETSSHMRTRRGSNRSLGRPGLPGAPRAAQAQAEPSCSNRTKRSSKKFSFSERSCFAERSFAERSSVAGGGAYAGHGHLTGASMPHVSTIACGAVHASEALGEAASGAARKCGKNITFFL
jgi:hypothetical protein